MDILALMKLQSHISSLDSGSGDAKLIREAVNEITRFTEAMRKIEDVTNTDAEHDADYGAVVERVNALARKALWHKD
jgi:hypothetical protein